LEEGSKGGGETAVEGPADEDIYQRNKNGGQFMAVEKIAKKFKGVRQEK
jgi:hypothetical protein